MSIGIELRSALRSLRQRPGLSALVIVVFALGMGATVSILSITRAALLKPLPYREPDRLTLVWSDLRARGQRGFPVAGPTYVDLTRESSQFESLTAFFSRTSSLLVDGGDPVPLEIGEVTPSFLATLGVQPVIGRGFSEMDATVAQDEATLANNTASPTAMILNYRLWREAYGENPAIIGRVVDLGGARVEVVGVLPAGLVFDLPGDAPFSMRVDALVAMRAALDRAPRDNPFLAVMGRLRPRASIQTAQQDAARLAADLRRRFGMYQAAGFEFDIRPFHADLTKQARPILGALLAATGLLLLIACANSGGLLLLRGLARQREFSVRAALGAGTWQIFRQLLLEGAVLATFASALAIPIAFSLNGALVWWQPAFILEFTPVTIDWPVLLGAAAISALSTMLFAVLPMLQLRHQNVVDALRGRGADVGRSAYGQSALVIGELALAVVLLAGAGLLIRTILDLSRISPGFESDGVLSFRVTIPPERYPDAARRALFSQTLQQAISSIPGVVSASSVFPLPLGGRALSGRFGLADAEADPSRYRQGDYRIVLPGYFETLRTRVIEGRTFDIADNSDGTPVVIIDRKLAERLWSGQSAIGRRLLIRLSREAEWVEVIGVVEHQRPTSIAEEGRETVYFTDGFAVGKRASPIVSLSLDWVVLAITPVATLAPQVRATVASIDPRLAVADIAPFERYIRRSTSSLRAALTLLSVFAVVALGLAAIGLSGVLQQRMTQRANEMAIRKAIGASESDVLRLILKSGIGLIAPGLAIGLACALWSNEVLTSQVPGLTRQSMLMAIEISLLLLVISGIAVWIPARRASRINPAVITRA